jgi:hypothetical protein
LHAPRRGAEASHDIGEPKVECDPIHGFPLLSLPLIRLISRFLGSVALMWWDSGSDFVG